MKVLEHGPKSWRLAIQCPDCKSQLALESDDEFYWESLGSFDEFSTYYYVDCAACGSQIDLTKKLPEWIKRKAKKR